MISIGDTVKAHHDQLEMENYYMRSYIQGEGGEVGTAPEASLHPSVAKNVCDATTKHP
jgi:hypothetical protein